MSSKQKYLLKLLLMEIIINMIEDCGIDLGQKQCFRIVIGKYLL